MKKNIEKFIDRKNGNSCMNFKPIQCNHYFIKKTYLFDFHHTNWKMDSTTESMLKQSGEKTDAHPQQISKFRRYLPQVKCYHSKAVGAVN